MVNTLAIVNRQRVFPMEMPTIMRNNVQLYAKLQLGQSQHRYRP